MGLDVLAGVSLPITVKNTFIDIGAPTPTAQRRSSSAPPVEFASSGAASEDEDFISTPVDAAVKASTVASTAASSTASASPASTPLATLRLSSRARPFQPWPARATAAALPPPMPRAAAAPQHLVSWQQGYTCSSLELIGQVVLTLASALASSGEVQVVARAVDSQPGWLVDIEVAPFECMAQVLEQAMTTLLGLAEQSSSVYVMGYRAKPFQEKHNAFQAMLGVMEDANLACWDAFSEGVCYRGHCCRWQHPSCTKCLLVAVRPLLGVGSAEVARPMQPFFGEECGYIGQCYF